MSVRLLALSPARCTMHRDRDIDRTPKRVQVETPCLDLRVPSPFYLLVTRPFRLSPGRSCSSGAMLGLCDMHRAMVFKFWPTSIGGPFKHRQSPLIRPLPKRITRTASCAGLPGVTTNKGEASNLTHHPLGHVRATAGPLILLSVMSGSARKVFDP